MSISLRQTRRGSLGFAALVVSSAGAPGLAQEVVLRYSAWLPPTYFMHERGLYPFFADIERVTEGRVRIEISSAPLGPAPRNYQLVMDGISDITWSLHGYTPGTFPLSELVELPFHSTDAISDSVAYWHVFKEFFEPAGMHPGMHTLTVHTHVPGQLFNNVRAIDTPEDIQGLRIRSTNSSVATSLQRLGAAPIGIPVPEMRQALERGIVDGVTLTDEALYNFQIASFIRHGLVTPGGLYNASFFAVVNEEKWNQISETDQAAIMEISGEVLARRMGEVWQAEQDGATERVLADGIVLSPAEGVLLEHMQAALAGLDDEWLERAQALGVDAAAALAAYRNRN
jgi:TRAP-type C4-dicarboxylate transport system substrate-binding protein